jgi:hypothetical protein
MNGTITIRNMPMSAETFMDLMRTIIRGTYPEDMPKIDMPTLNNVFVGDNNSRTPDTSLRSWLDFPMTNTGLTSTVGSVPGFGFDFGDDARTLIPFNNLPSTSTTRGTIPLDQLFSGMFDFDQGNTGGGFFGNQPIQTEEKKFFLPG